MKKVILLALTAVLALSGCESMKENPNTAKGLGIGGAAGAAKGTGAGVFA